jgi:hypothetical protein
MAGTDSGTVPKHRPGVLLTCSATPTGLPRQPVPPIVACYLRTTRLNLVDAVCLVGLDESLTVMVTE